MGIQQAGIAVGIEVGHCVVSCSATLGNFVRARQQVRVELNMKVYGRDMFKGKDDGGKCGGITCNK